MAKKESYPIPNPPLPQPYYHMVVAELEKGNVEALNVALKKYALTTEQKQVTEHLFYKLKLKNGK